tara:strand:- start:116 stop:874 length:759 start_codon:yes stop_codon:yes gene_type:complete
MIEILILSIVQGITEFLPISSSSHLILISNYLEFSNQSLTINVSLHIGSFLAVLFYFRKDIANFINNKKLFTNILISSIPVMVFGFVLVKLNLTDYLRDIKIIGWMTLIFGILLFISDKFKNKKDIKNNFNIKSALFIGFFQILSLIPGVSRSGISITAARFLGFKRVDSARLSFLLSIPTLAAVSFFGINNLIIANDLQFSLINLFSVLLSFLFSLITISFFLKYIERFNLNIFVLYRVILGLIILILAYL